MKARSETSPKPKILIVEDEQIIALDLRETLHELGYVIIGVVDSGEQAVETAETTRPDVVLMDVRLKGEIDGIAAADTIFRRFHIPVVFLTASANDETVMRARSAGPYGFVIKPVRPRDLNATVLVALYQHRIARELFAEHTWLQSVLSGMTDAVIAIDDAEQVRFLNPAAESLTGWSNAEASGSQLERIYPVTNLDGTPASSRRPCKGSGASGKARFLLQRRDNSVAPIESVYASLNENGRNAGAVLTFTDITERLRREREQLEEKERLEEEVQSTAQALGATRAELRALSAHLMTVQEEERRRVARDLHDDLGQRLAALEFSLGCLQSRTPDISQQARADLMEAARQTAELSHSLRAVSHGLHSTVISDLGIECALRMLVDEHRRGGEDVKVVLRGMPERISVDVSVVLYRIAQEALRNASRHAPGAAVQVVLERRGGELNLVVRDQGPGFDIVHVREKGCLGLLSIQERAKLAGGNVVLRSAPGEGTSIQVKVPLAG
jgi:PAS domain S-box-containing protein